MGVRWLEVKYYDIAVADVIEINHCCSKLWVLHSPPLQNRHKPRLLDGYHCGGEACRMQPAAQGAAVGARS